MILYYDYIDFISLIIISKTIFIISLYFIFCVLQRKTQTSARCLKAVVILILLTRVEDL